MSRQSKWEYLRLIHHRYSKRRRDRNSILDEFCLNCGYRTGHEPHSGLARVGLCITITLTRGFGQSAISVVSLALVGKWFARGLNFALGSDARADRRIRPYVLQLIRGGGHARN